MKRFGIIVVLLLVLSMAEAFAQFANVSEYTRSLKKNIQNYGPSEGVVTDYCNEYEKNINTLFSKDEPVKIGNEKYQMNDISRDFYNAFQSFDYKTKCRLLYCMADLRSEIYFPESLIDSLQGLEFLPLAVSALDRFYSDGNSAFGLWGLHYLPAARYGLVADSCYDERLDLALASVAAAKYLNYLHQSFGSWDYAFTAYVCGPAKLRKAMIGNNSFEKTLKNLEPRYHNSFYILIAVIRWMEENETVNPSFTSIQRFANNDTVIISERIHFAQIAEVLQVDYDILRQINPLFTGNVIDGKVFPKKVYLPDGKKESFIALKDSIRNFKDSVYFSIYKPMQTSVKDMDYAYGSSAYVSQSPGADFEEIKYKIASGDNLGSIAQKYGIKVSDLKDWNNISGTNIYAGKTISIWVKKGTVSNSDKPKINETKNKTESVQETTTTSNHSAAKKSFESKDYTIAITYVVKSGDSFYEIATNYSWATAEDIMLWNNISDPSKLQIGQKLKIYKKK